MKKVFLLFAIFAVSVLVSCEPKKRSSTGSSQSSYSDSEKESIRVYRIGYNDGRNAYGLPASSRASASEVYLANGYNFRRADYQVYVMGYEDGMYGRSKQY